MNDHDFPWDLFVYWNKFLTEWSWFIEDEWWSWFIDEWWSKFIEDEWLRFSIRFIDDEWWSRFIDDEWWWRFIEGQWLRFSIWYIVRSMMKIYRRWMIKILHKIYCKMNDHDLLMINDDQNLLKVND
jgi:hypothetical protein